MKIPKTKKSESQLHAIKRKLQRYCHHKDCNDFESCPENHDHDERCSKYLGLDTAMAWRIAETIDILTGRLYTIRHIEWTPTSATLEISLPHHLKTLRKELENIRFLVAESIKMLDLHYPRYKKLGNLLDKLHEIICDNEDRYGGIK